MMVILTLVSIPLTLVWLQTGTSRTCMHTRHTHAQDVHLPSQRTHMPRRNSHCVEWVLLMVGMPPKVALLSAFWVKLLIPGMVRRR